MIKLKKLIKAFIFMPCMAALFLSSCADSNLDESCDFDVEEILNGPNKLNPQTEWDCLDNQNQAFSIGFFADQTGLDSTEGEFIWQEIRCGSIEYSINFKNIVLSQITLNEAKNLLSYQRQIDGIFSSVTCNIDFNPLDLL